MDLEIELSGTFSQDIANVVRENLPGITVVTTSGMAGGRRIKIIAKLTKDTLEAVKKAISNVLGTDQIKGFSVTCDGVKFDSVPPERLSEAKTIALEILDRLQQLKK